MCVCVVLGCVCRPPSEIPPERVSEMKNSGHPHPQIRICILRRSPVTHMCVKLNKLCPKQLKILKRSLKVSLSKRGVKFATQKVIYNVLFQQLISICSFCKRENMHGLCSRRAWPHLSVAVRLWGKCSVCVSFSFSCVKQVQ